MTRRNPFLVLFAMFTIAWLAGRPACAAAAPIVRDQAHLLKPETVERVNALVKEIQEKFGKDLTIKTFATIPDNLKANFSAQKKDVFYEQWLRNEAHAAKTDGVFILIVHQPGHLQVGVGNETKGKAFTYADRDELRDLMLKAFRDEKFDDGIIEGAQFVRARMARNLGEPLKNLPPETTPAIPAGPQTQSAAQSVPATQPSRSEAGPTTRPTDEPATGKNVKPESDAKSSASDGVQLNK